MAYLAEHLRTVGVEEDLVLSADCADFLEGLSHTDFVVDAHDGDEDCFVGDGAFQDVQIDKSILLNGKIGDFKTALGEPAAAI